jgi:Histidine kinase-, DNA gyrase B-, and HSP90-like ATPase
MTAHSAGVVAAIAGPLTALLGDRLPELATAWPGELAAEGRFAPAVPAPEAARFVEAVAAAVSDRLEPLAGLAGIDTGDREGMAGRLDVVLSALDALRRCVLRLDGAAAGTGPGPEPTAAAFAAVGRALAARALSRLEGRPGSPAPGSAPNGPAAASAADPLRTSPMGVTLHELRRPLTIVSSYGQLLAAGTLGELPDRAATAVTALCGATETMLRLVQALSAVNRLEDPAELPAFCEHDVAALVRTALDDLSTEIQLGGARPVLDLEEGLHVRGDGEWLVVAFTNLVENAVKHSPEGGRVEVRVRRDAAVVRVTVRDHGPGFPAEDAGRLFDKYFRSPAERDRGIPGSGLGLFIVRSVAERHRGQVAARLPEDGGAEFELVLPLS